jgi:predicted Zn-dependent protease
VQVVSAEGRLCPGCGTRAKAKWEFCPRCGESLANAAEAPRADAAAADVDDATDAQRYESAGGSWKGFAGAVALLAVSIVAFVTLRNPGPQPASTIFEVPDDTRVPPATAPPLTRKGADAFEKGRIRLTEGDVQGAIPLLAEAVAQDSENALYRHTYGRALWLGNAKEAALAELAAAANLSPGSPVYWTELGRAQKDVGRTADALRSFEQATNLFPESFEILKDYGALLARLDDRQRAATVLKRVADKRPGDAILQQEMAHALESTGDLGSAAELYRRVVATVPDAPIARSRLAELMIQQNNPAEAVAVLREGLEKTPGSSLLYRSLGSALERTGSVAEAVAAYRQYVARAGDTNDAREIEQRAAALERQLAARS